MNQINEQVDFSSFEKEEIKNIQNSRLFHLEDGSFSFKKFLSVSITTCITNFMTKRKWQLGLLLYLLITCPVGTYTSIKFIFHLFF